MAVEDDAPDLALRLIASQRTLVLATADPAPWSAPVYYVYRDHRFYFFSSAKSRHVRAARASGRCAATIFRDGDDWREIEGLQIDGAIEDVPAGAEALAAFTAYVGRFPTVRTLLPGAVLDLDHLARHLRARLYAFVPGAVHYLNNRAGFATRREIELPE